MIKIIAAVVATSVIITGLIAVTDAMGSALDTQAAQAQQAQAFIQHAQSAAQAGR